jgi:hypothetical protein
LGQHLKGELTMYTQGIATANQVGDQRAAREMTDALQALG